MNGCRLIKTYICFSWESNGRGRSKPFSVEAVRYERISGESSTVYNECYIRYVYLFMKKHTFMKLFWIIFFQMKIIKIIDTMIICKCKIIIIINKLIKHKSQQPLLLEAVEPFQWTLAQRQQTVNVATLSTAVSNITWLVLCVSGIPKKLITGLNGTSPPSVRGDVLQIWALMRRSCAQVSCHCVVTGQRWRVNVEEEAVSPHGPHQASVAYNASVIGPCNDSQRSLPLSWMEERSFTLGRSFS